MTVSRTSQAVALTRASFARPHSAQGDPDAQRRLCAGMRPVVLTDHKPSLEARTRFFDDQVIAAITAGVRQIVVLGAGYDDRGLRFATPGVTFFELDHPGTQADKRSRLTAILGDGTGRAGPSARPARPVLAPADFTTADIAAVLMAAGHDPAAPSLFLCEGLLVYLDQPTTVRLLAGVRAAAGVASTLAASLAIHADGLETVAVLRAANARRRTADAEPWLTILPAGAQADLLTRAGWRINGAIDVAELGTGAAAGHCLLVTASPAGASA